MNVFYFAPPAGIEPATNRLTGDCSTAELQRNMLFWLLGQDSNPNQEIKTTFT
jgi:hypothetical protein